MPHSKPDVAMHGTRLNLPLGFSPRRSGPKRLESERCGAALTAPSLRQAFTDVPHPRRGGCVCPHSSNFANPFRNSREPRCCRTMHYMSTRHTRAMTGGKRQTPQTRCGSLGELCKRTPCYPLKRAKMDIMLWGAFAKTKIPAAQTSIACYIHSQCANALHKNGIRTT